MVRILPSGGRWQHVVVMISLVLILIDIKKMLVEYDGCVRMHNLQFLKSTIILQMTVILSLKFK